MEENNEPLPFLVDEGGEYRESDFKVDENYLKGYTPLMRPQRVRIGNDTKTVEIRSSDHARKQFHKRFVTGEEQASYNWGLFYLKDFPGWKPLKWPNDFRRVYLQGANRIILDDKLALGGYIIKSKSTRMVLMARVCEVNDIGGKRIEVLVNTVYHSAMPGSDQFKLRGENYPFQNVIVEARDFFEWMDLDNYLKAMAKHSKRHPETIFEEVEAWRDDELQIGVWFHFELGRICANYPIVEVD